MGSIGQGTCYGLVFWFNRAWRRANAESLRCHLLDKYGVGLISIGDKDLRIAFSCLEENEIPELFNIVLQGVKDLER